MAETSTLEIGFSLRGIGGLVAVSVTVSTDPDAIGYRLLTGGQPADFAVGFPVCRASVTYPADGMTWAAHSFLCVSPDAVVTPRVQAIAGFRWGFAVSGAKITLARPAPLESQAWDGHLALLRASYPQWAFDPGYLPA